MESKIFQPNSKNILKASKILQEGGIVVFPTETVYGIGANALNDKAIERIYAAKKRPQNNPLIVHVENLERARSIAHFSEIELFLAENFWPGPLTLVLNNGSQEISKKVTAGLRTIAIRVPKNATAISLLKSFGKPIAAPSANISGEISPTLATHALDLKKDVEMILDGNYCEIGLESTILKCGGGKIDILREGSVTRENIKKVISFDFPKIEISLQSPGKEIISPGQLLTHYSPKSNLRLNVLEPSKEEVYLAFGSKEDSVEGFSLSENKILTEAARNLYNYLRLADEMILKDPNSNKKSIAVAPIPNYDLGASINDRLLRASTLKR